MPALHDYDVPTAQYLVTGLYISFTCIHDATRISITISDTASSDNWVILAPIDIGTSTVTGGTLIDRGFHTFVWDGYDNNTNQTVPSPTTVNVSVFSATPYDGYVVGTVYIINNVVLT